ncbi:hypothetical protein SDC9_121185 [bioreactor metagenome]|uniref:Uncharacterized protein n=1 Tax=bioreactor metagenome TaxID=1076179 RepID=A0A645CBA0_9ZZZZ
MKDQLFHAKKLLGIIDTVFNEFEKSFVNMTMVQMNNERLQDYLKKVFPEPGNPKDTIGKNKALRQREWAEYFFQEGKGNRIKGVQGTLWAAYNGVTELLDHAKKKNMDRHLNSIWFGEDAAIKMRAFHSAEKILKKCL